MRAQVESNRNSHAGDLHKKGIYCENWGGESKVLFGLVYEN